jgi:hypothetical protein
VSFLRMGKSIDPKQRGTATVGQFPVPPLLGPTNCPNSGRDRALDLIYFLPETTANRNENTSPKNVRVLRPSDLRWQTGYQTRPPSQDV